MQYVRSIAGSVNGAWNSINPATLSGAVDVIVVEQDDGALACSPFIVRFGKWRLLRPYEKKVEFRVNGRRLDFPMKLGEGGEAFFVFETHEDVPAALQTSPVVSPETSPQLQPSAPDAPVFQEPDLFELDNSLLGSKPRQHSKSASFSAHPTTPGVERAQSEIGRLTPPPHVSAGHSRRPLSTDLSGYSPPQLKHTVTDSDLSAAKASTHTYPSSNGASRSVLGTSPLQRSSTPPDTRVNPPATPRPAMTQEEARTRAVNLSKKLWTSNISNQVTDSGDVMLDMTNYKSSDGEALHAEMIARQLLSEEIDGPYDIGALIGADENGNIWIYSSVEAKDAASSRVAQALGSYSTTGFASSDALLDQGYHSDDAKSDSRVELSGTHFRRDSDSAIGISSTPSSPGQLAATGDPNKNYAKTLRLTSDQLKSMDLSSGANTMSFTVNRATCTATLWYWRHDIPIVISDIDGTITKSDVLGHVMNSIGRDWTHPGVAKLYTEISSNGYNFLYLTSRSVGQADTTRNYLDGVVQEGYRLPRGPVILSPDRTMAALRREVYLRKPELFKMACLRDIMALFSGHGGSNISTEPVDAGLPEKPPGYGSGRGRGGSPFYAGFGNRLTDALSYRSVNIPSTRIFTINSYSEVSLDLLSLNNYKTAYGTMREIVDYYFPPIGLLVKGGGEEFTDFNYWRDKPLDLVDFTDSESEEEAVIEDALLQLTSTRTKGSVLSEDDAGDDMLDSFISDPRQSLEESLTGSTAGEEELTSSLVLDEELDDGDDEYDEEDEELEDEDAEDGDVDDDRPTTPDLSKTRPPLRKDSEVTPRRSVDLLDDR